ncbi:MAG: hypothetical protein U5L10_01950 [Candidatus Moranbacteria bacterium]|nr:hypothetical protein [Candidatus Moranbacteria bacterium]
MAKSLNVKNSGNYCQRKEKNKPASAGRAVCGVLNPRFISFALLFMICLSGMAYIFQVNKIATMGYLVNKKQEKLDELREEKRGLEIKMASLKSAYRFKDEENVFKNKMVKPDKVGYIEVDSVEPVAMK